MSIAILLAKAYKCKYPGNNNNLALDNIGYDGCYCESTNSMT